MSYRCGLCRAKCKGVMRKHIVYRPGGQVASETPVCSTCQGLITDGVQMKQLSLAAVALPSETVVVEVAPQPATQPKPTPAKLF
jgi:hypothetical protein